MPCLPQMVSSEILLLNLQAQGEWHQSKQHPSQKLIQHESLDLTLLLCLVRLGPSGIQPPPKSPNPPRLKIIQQKSIIDTHSSTRDTPVSTLPTSKMSAIKKLHTMIGSTYLGEYLHSTSQTQERAEQHGMKRMNIQNNAPWLSSSNDDNKPPIPQKEIKQATPSLVYHQAGHFSTLKKKWQHHAHNKLPQAQSGLARTSFQHYKKQWPTMPSPFKITIWIWLFSQCRREELHPAHASLWRGPAQSTPHPVRITSQLLVRIQTNLDPWANIQKPPKLAKHENSPLQWFNLPLLPLNNSEQIKDIDDALKFSNYKGTEQQQELLLKLVKDNVNRGFALPLPLDKILLIPGVLRAPSNIKLQIMMNERRDIIPKNRLTCNQSWKWQSGTSINSRVDKKELMPCYFEKLSFGS